MTVRRFILRAVGLSVVAFAAHPEVHRLMRVTAGGHLDGDAGAGRVYPILVRAIMLARTPASMLADPTGSPVDLWRQASFSELALIASFWGTVLAGTWTLLETLVGRYRRRRSTLGP